MRNNAMTRIRNQLVALAAARLVPMSALGSPGMNERKVDDAGIATAVETEFMMEHVVPFDEIDVTVHDGVVTAPATRRSWTASRASSSGHRSSMRMK